MTERVITIGGRRVGDGEPAFIIAEVGQNHDGSLGLAHAHIDAAADAGADAVKFQTHIASAESTLDEPFRVRFSQQDGTRYEYWQRMEFTEEQWVGLAAHATERGLVFLSSPFSVDAVELLARVGVPAWKVGSGEAGNAELVDAMIAAGGPILLSTGMSTFDEIVAAVERFHGAGAEVAVFQCTSRYPADTADVGLNVLDELRGRVSCPVGLSDHSGTRWPAIAAIARGTSLVELHITLDPRLFGPDVAASLSVEHFADVVAARDAFVAFDQSPVDKDAMARELEPMRALFGRSLAPRARIEAGTVIEHDMLVGKKPATGIPVAAAGDVVGRRAAHSLDPDRLLRWEDLDDA